MKRIHRVLIYSFDEATVVEADVTFPKTGGGKKIADVILHFTGGWLADMALYGISVWKKVDGEWSVTFPQHSWVDKATGEKKRVTFLRPSVGKNKAAWVQVEQEIITAVRQAELLMEEERRKG